jgi:O-acetyl-ADP-ribose deacetylase (regulator of RNase III)
VSTIQYKKGCLIAAFKNKEIDVLAHGVNCQGVMGSGVAKLVRKYWPDVFEQYIDWIDHTKEYFIGGTPLGSVCSKSVGRGQFISNLYTQDYYGSDGKKYVMYDAIAESFSHLLLHFNTHKIGIPKIGAGLGGGNWTIIEALINEQIELTEFSGSLTVYTFE